MPFESFDASRDFVVRTRSLLCAGTNYTKGDRFNPDSVAPHVTKMLFNSRQIGYSDDPLGGMIKSDPLLTGKGKRKGTAPPPKPSGGELERAEALAESKTKPELLELAADIEGVRKDMNKKAIALAIIRAGHGIS